MIHVGPFQLRIFRDSTPPPFLLGWHRFPQWLEIISQVVLKATNLLETKNTFKGREQIKN